MTDIILDQIMKIRDTGLVNMCSGYEVQKLAFERDFFELVCYIDEHPREVCYIDEHPREYLQFILYGDKILL